MKIDIERFLNVKRYVEYTCGIEEDDEGEFVPYSNYKELLDTIVYAQEKFKIDVEKATDKAVNREYADLQSMNLWHRLCWAIKRIWED